MQKLLLLAIAGAAGTLARYFTYLMTNRFFGDGFPWGTLAVNMSGCFLFGLVCSVSEEYIGMNPDTRSIVLVGFMGAFTTFSTFAFDTGAMIRESQWLAATGNVAVQATVGIAVVFLGMAVGSKLG